MIIMALFAICISTFMVSCKSEEDKLIDSLEVAVENGDFSTSMDIIIELSNRDLSESQRARVEEIIKSY